VPRRLLVVVLDSPQACVLQLLLQEGLLLQVVVVLGCLLVR
jgi:hypothetical protein